MYKTRLTNLIKLVKWQFFRKSHNKTFVVKTREFHAEDAKNAENPKTKTKSCAPFASW